MKNMVDRLRHSYHYFQKFTDYEIPISVIPNNNSKKATFVKMAKTILTPILFWFFTLLKTKYVFQRVHNSVPAIIIENSVFINRWFVQFCNDHRPINKVNLLTC